MDTKTISASDLVNSESSSETSDHTRQVVANILAGELATADWSIEGVPSVGPDATLSSGGGSIPRSTQKHLADKVAAKLHMRLPDKRRPVQPKPIQQTFGGHGVSSLMQVRSQQRLLPSDRIVFNQTTADKVLALLGTSTDSIDRHQAFPPFFPVESRIGVSTSIQGAETSTSLSLSTWSASTQSSLVKGYSFLSAYGSRCVATHHQPMLPPTANPVAFSPAQWGVVHPYQFPGLSPQPRISFPPTYDRRGSFLSSGDRMSAHGIPPAFVFDGHSPMPPVPTIDPVTTNPPVAEMHPVGERSLQTFKEQAGTTQKPVSRIETPLVPRGSAPSRSSPLTTPLRPRACFEPTVARRKRKDSDRKEEKQEEQKNSGYTDLDVLLGRGGRAANHPGNQRYLALKDKMQKMYNYKDARKSRKTIISQELLAAVKAWGGRFMKLDKVTGRWVQVANCEAQKKASQALREINTPEERAKKRMKYPKLYPIKKRDSGDK